MTKIKVKCDKCGIMFYVTEKSIASGEVQIGNQKLYVSYFICDKCEHMYVISVEDDFCRKQRLQIERDRKAISKSIKNGNSTITKIMRLRVVRESEVLKKYMDDLQKKYKGTFTYIASVNNDKDHIVYHEDVD